MRAACRAPASSRHNALAAALPFGRCVRQPSQRPPPPTATATSPPSPSPHRYEPPPQLSCSDAIMAVAAPASFCSCHRCAVGHGCYQAPRECFPQIQAVPRRHRFAAALERHRQLAPKSRFGSDAAVSLCTLVPTVLPSCLAWKATPPPPCAPRLSAAYPLIASPVPPPPPAPAP